LLKENGKLSEKLHSLADKRETSDDHSKQNGPGKSNEEKIRKNQISSEQINDESSEAKRTSGDQTESVVTVPSTIATDEDGDGSFFTTESMKKPVQPTIPKNDTKPQVHGKFTNNRAPVTTKDFKRTPHPITAEIDGSTAGSKAKTAKAVNKTMKLKEQQQHQQQQTPAKSNLNPFTESKEEQDIQLIVTATLEAIDYCQGQELFPTLHEGVPPKSRSSPMLTHEEIAINNPLPPYNALPKDVQTHLLSVLHQFAKTLSHFFAILVDLNVNPNPQTRQSTVHHHSSMQPIISIHSLQSFLIKIKLIDNSLVTLQDAYLVFNKFRAKHLTLFGTAFSMVLLGQKYFSSPVYGIINYVLFLEKLQYFLHESLVVYRKQQVAQVDETIEVEPVLTNREFQDVIKLLQKEIKPLMVLYESYLPYVSNKQLENAAASIVLQANAKRSGVSSTPFTTTSSQVKESTTRANNAEVEGHDQQLHYEQQIVYSLSANCATPLDATQGATPHHTAAANHHNHQQHLSPTAMRITDLQATSATPEVGQTFQTHSEEDIPSTIIINNQEQYPHQPLSSSAKPVVHRIHLSPHTTKFQLPNNVFHYYLPSSTTTATPIPKVLTFSEILQFAKEFQIIPSMYSRQQLYEIYRSTVPRSDQFVPMNNADEEFLFSNSITLDFPMVSNTSLTLFMSMLTFIYSFWIVL
jgi:hypothetical protein